MDKSIIQFSLLIFFAFLLAVCIGILAFTEDQPEQLGVTILVLAGCTVLAALLPRLQAFSITLEGITATLAEQQKDIDALKFLVTGYVTNFELDHLRKLAGPDRFLFDKGDTFCDELRRLWRHGLISKHRDDWYIAQLPHSGNLKEFVTITDRGKTYLRLLAEVEEQQAKQ